MRLPSHAHLPLTSFRQGTALVLVVIMIFAAVPSTLAASGARDAAQSLVATSKSALAKARETILRQRSNPGPSVAPGRMPPKQIVPAVKPRASRTREEHAGRVAALEINPSGTVVVQTEQPMILSAVPLDRDGVPVHGLHPEWDSSNKRVVTVRNSGELMARHPGSAVVTARAGNMTRSITVTVSQANEKFGGKKRENTGRSNRGIGLSAIRIRSTNTRKVSNLRRAHSLSELIPSTSKAAARAPMPQNPITFDPLPDSETNSLYLAENAVGFPPGKKRPGAQTAAVATGGTENGNRNFSFGLPVAGLSGRGLDVSLSLNYHSQMWNKSDDGTNTYLTYNVDSDWPAPGFRLGFGQLDDQGSYGFTLTEADGTRRALVNTSTYNYDTNDGSFIHYTGGSGWGALYYPNGTQVVYGASGGGYRSYPTMILDRNGNYILISYVDGVGPKISTIEDTLQRYVRFYYASSGDLVAITAPGLTGNSDLQMMRFYYASSDIDLTTSGLFGSGVISSLPPSNAAHVLQYVYLPSSADGSGAHIGYKFEYSSYGMIYRMTQFRGMTVSSTSTTTAGAVTEGTNTVAAVTTYDYPGSSVNSTTGLSDVPKYSTRTDDWAGRTTSSAPYYTFSTSTATDEKISTITAPDGTITETHSNDLPGQWNDGLVIKTRAGYGSGPTWLTETITDWELDSANSNTRVAQVRSTNVAAGLTNATVFSYTSYNNVSAVSERAFTTNNSVSSTELRRTETSYVTSPTMSTVTCFISRPVYRSSREGHPLRRRGLTMRTTTMAPRTLT